MNSSSKTTKNTSINEDCNYVGDTSQIQIMNGVSIVKKLGSINPLTSSEEQDLKNNYRVMYSLLRNKLQ